MKKWSIRINLISAIVLIFIIVSIGINASIIVSVNVSNKALSQAEQILRISKSNKKGAETKIISSENEQKKQLWAIEKYNEYWRAATPYISPCESICLTLNNAVSEMKGQATNKATAGEETSKQFTGEIKLKDMREGKWETANLEPLGSYDEIINSEMENKVSGDKIEYRIKNMEQEELPADECIVTYMRIRDNFSLAVAKSNKAEGAIKGSQETVYSEMEYDTISKGDQLGTILNILSKQGYKLAVKEDKTSKWLDKEAAKYEAIEQVKTIQDKTLDNVLVINELGGSIKDWEITLRNISNISNTDDSIVYKTYILKSKDEQLDELEYDMDIINTKILEDRYIAEFSDKQ